MANQTYKISATIGSKYAPLISHRRVVHELTPKSKFSQMREVGASNIDLWVDGSIYPHNPVDNKRPHFRSVSQLLEFVAEERMVCLGILRGCATEIAKLILC